MSYSEYEEKTANKDIIKDLTLKEIREKYGYGDLLKYEINRRSSSNINEIRDFYKNDFHMAYRGNYEKDLAELSAIMKVQPIELLSWDNFVDIIDDIAVKYLNGNYEWLNNDKIVGKVSENYLYKSLLEDDNIYKYQNLLEKLSDQHLREIITNNKTDYSRLTNLIPLISRLYVLPTSDLNIIINKLVNQKQYNKITQLLSLNNFKEYELENIVLEIQKMIPSNDFLNLLNIMPQNIINIINKDNHFFKKLILDNYNKSPMILEDLLNSDFSKSLPNDLYGKIFSSLQLDNGYELIIKNNNVYNRVKNSIDLNNFNYYFANNIDRYIEYILKSDVIIENMEKILDANLEQNIKGKIFDYVTKDTNSIEKFIEIYGEIGVNFIQYIISNNIHIKKEFNQNQIKAIGSVIERLNLNLNQLMYLIDNYPSIKDMVFNENVFSKINLMNEDLYTFIDKYPEIISRINPEIILNSQELLKNLFKYQNFQKVLINDKRILNIILSDEEKILEFMPVLYQYDIKNEKLEKYKENFKKIQKVRPELSLGNSSLRTCMFHDDFIDTLGLNYINAILNYDSEASDIVEGLYKEKELSKLKEYLDFLCDNVSDNYRMIHFYIRTYSKTKELINDLITKNVSLDEYQKQLLEEIIGNENLYNISSLEELNNYFQIKTKKILDEDLLDNEQQVENALELFLNTSSLRLSVPGFDFASHNLNDLNLEYYKYKYLDKGIITNEEYDYLLKVREIIINNKCDYGLAMELISEYQNRRVPTIKMILDKIYQANMREYNSKLLDLDEVREVASRDNPESEVYIEEQEGLEFIHLKGYDFKCLSSRSNYRIEGAATYDHTGSQVIRYSEKLKDKIGRDKIVKTNDASLVRDVPETWELMEAVATISTTLVSSRNIEEVNGHTYSWGKSSNVSLFGANPSDAHVDHSFRALYREGSTEQSVRTAPGRIVESDYLYLGGGKEPELWFDRSDENSQRRKPEFMIIYDTDDFKKESVMRSAKYFNCPIVVVHGEYYDNNYEEKLDLKARKKFLQTFSIDDVNDILFNHSNENEDEKVDFIVNSLGAALKGGRIDFMTYKSRLIDLKWKLYEEHFEKQLQRVDSLLSSIDNSRTIEEEQQRGLSRGTISTIFIIAISSIIIFIILLIKVLFLYNIW